MLFNDSEKWNQQIIINEDEDTDLLELLEISFNEMVTLLMLRQFDEVIAQC